MTFEFLPPDPRLDGKVKIFRLNGVPRHGRENGSEGSTGDPISDFVPSWRDQVVRAPDLCDQTFPEVKFLVPGLFPEGVTLLVSRPKLGKSWMLLQIGSSIAGGVTTLVSADEPLCGDVLYLSLEDNRRRVQRRMTKYFGGIRECWPSRLEVVTTWRRLDQGGLKDLREWCSAVPEPTLIMIDTLKKVRPPKRHGQTDYDADYEASEGLVTLAHDFPGLAFIVAHHDRKMAADDPFDTVSGTLGLTGGVDTIAILKRGGVGVTLYIQGRDLVEDIEKAVRFERESCRWTILGEAAEVHRSGERARVIEALRDAASGGLSVGEIMAAAEICSRAAADALLYRMSKAGEISRQGRGRYVLPATRPSEPSESQNASQSTETQGENGPA
jgi:AAA domain